MQEAGTELGQAQLKLEVIADIVEHVGDELVKLFQMVKERIKKNISKVPLY